MPIPVITDHFLAQVVIPFEGPIGDAATNTFYFRNDGLPGVESMAARIDTTLTAFYTDINPPGTASLASFYSGAIKHSAVHIKVYDLGDPAPRTPTVVDLTWPSAVPAEPYFPNEVAAVLSFRSGPGTAGSGGTSDKRKRGRVYIGPLNALSGTYETAASSDVLLSTGFRNALAGAAENLLENSLEVKWMQYSRVANVMSEVEGGFVNNAFDTQRRRGQPATARTLWPATP